MSATSLSKTKSKNPARRERLHPDWPVKVQVYRCWPLCAASHFYRVEGCPDCLDAIPQDLWDTAHKMRRLWNEFTALLRDILAKVKGCWLWEDSRHVDFANQLWLTVEVKEDWPWEDLRHIDGILCSRA